MKGVLSVVFNLDEVDVDKYYFYDVFGDSLLLNILGLCLCLVVVLCLGLLCLILRFVVVSLLLRVLGLRWRLF